MNAGRVRNLAVDAYVCELSRAGYTRKQAEPLVMQRFPHVQRLTARTWTRARAAYRDSLIEKNAQNAPDVRQTRANRAGVA